MLGGTILDRRDRQMLYRIRYHHNTRIIQDTWCSYPDFDSHHQDMFDAYRIQVIYVNS